MTEPLAFVYGDGLFQDVTVLSYADQLEQMSAAAFGEVVLSSLHFDGAGDLYYNDTRAVSAGQIQPTLNPELSGLLAALRGAGSVTRVGASIGPFVSDFQAFLANPHVTMTNLWALIDWLSLDSIDLDYETGSLFGPPDEAIVVPATGLVASLGVDVTYCPFDEVDFWLDCLAAVHANYEGPQPVTRFNLQVYGNGAQPVEWLEAVAVAGPRIGVTDAPAFVAPGYRAANNGPRGGTCPTFLTEQLTEPASDGISAAWVWNTSLIFETEGTIPQFCTTQDVLTPAGYADAILTGLTT